MAVTTENSTQIANGLAEPKVLNPSYDDVGRVRVKRFNFTQGAAAGDAGSIANLVKMQGGRPRTILAVYIAWSALGAARTLDVGHDGYTNAAGAAVAADPDAFVADIDASAAGAQLIQVNQVLDAKTDFNVTAQVNDATLPAADTFDGYVLYVED